MLRLGLICGECEDAVEKQEEAERLRERVHRATENCGLPREKRGQTWEEMDITGGREKVVETAKSWARGDTAGLLICGPVGTGKSRLAETAVWQRAQLGLPIRWISVARLIVMDRAGFGSNDKQAATKILTGNGALCLDDLDKVQPNEAIKSLLFVAIDNRVAAKKPLLVTTNLREDELLATFGEAIHSRLTGYCTVKAMTGHDRRKVAA